MDDDPRGKQTLAVAAAVAQLIAADGARSAVIGAAALAVHGYPRATRDLDLATELDPTTQLAALARACKAKGWEASLVLPDADDPLGGVLTVRGRDFDPVQVVNFHNPLAPRLTPAGEALAEAEPLRGNDGLRVVRIEHLVALKLYAGGPRNRSDVAALLDANPELDLARLREVCRRFELEPALAEILDQR